MAVENKRKTNKKTKQFIRPLSKFTTLSQNTLNIKNETTMSLGSSYYKLETICQVACRNTKFKGR